MKKFLIASLLFGTTVAMYAKSDVKVRVHTTCGTTVIREIGENPTIEDLRGVATEVNQEECGTSPKHITIIART